VISVCVTIKNRSRVAVDGRELTLFPNCVQSLVQSLAKLEPVTAELVVTDWNSTDWPLREWLEEAAAPWPVHIISQEGEFNRGRGRNAAAQAARGKELLFLDADCTLCPRLIQDGLNALHQGNAYFPVLYSFDNPDHTSGHWRHEGYGNCMVTRQVFDAVQGWPQHTSWGREDTGFHHRVKDQTRVIREEVPGFYHQWHPDELVWKDRYTSRAEDLRKEAAQLLETANQLNGIIPAGQRYILVDEDRFGASAPQHRHAIPFLEKDGRYWGAPPDDVVAVKELERLRNKGANFIAFAWMTFWWLEFYSGLNQYLRSHFPCIANSQHLIVFDLRQPVGGTR